MLAHGIGGIQNLPIPRWVFFAGAAGILVVSFLGLFFLWPKPVLAEKARGGRTFPAWLERFLLSPGLRVVAGALSFALLAFLWLGALVGKDDSGVNFTPTFVYVFFWVGMPIVSAVFGNVWRYLDPWRSAAEGVGWVAQPARPPRRTAVRVPGAPRPLAGRRPAPLVHGDGALVHRPVEPAGARARDRDLQRDHLVRRGALRLGGVVRERRRLRGRLPAPLADQPVRPARGRPPLRACPVLGPLGQGHDPGDDRRSSR